MPTCHKCPHNGKASNACLTCEGPSENLSRGGKAWVSLDSYARGDAPSGDSAAMVEASLDRYNRDDELDTLCRMDEEGDAGALYMGDDYAEDTGVRPDGSGGAQEGLDLCCQDRATHLLMAAFDAPAMLGKGTLEEVTEATLEGDDVPECCRLTLTKMLGSLAALSPVDFDLLAHVAKGRSMSEWAKANKVSRQAAHQRMATLCQKSALSLR